MFSTINRYPKVMVVAAFVLLIVIVQGLHAQVQPDGGAEFAAAPDAFQAVAAHKGWLLGDGRLFWTDDAGDSWQERTPADLAERKILAVEFLNAETGWLAAVGQASSGRATIEVARSEDGGLSWMWPAEGLFAQTGEAFFPGQAHLQFLDEAHGWLVLSQQTGSNFSIGELYRTADGGESWQVENAVSGGPVAFVSPLRGWMLGGPVDQEIHQSEDGGANWKQMRLPGLALNSQVQFFLPSFAANGRGTLPVLIPAKEGTVLRIYHSADHGRTWQRGTDTHFDIEYGQALPVAAAGGQVVASIPSGEFGPNINKGYSFGPEAVNSPRFQALALASPAYGWGLRMDQRCENQGACSQLIRMYESEDGGLTWSVMSMPEQLEGPAASDAAEEVEGATSTTIEKGLLGSLHFEGQGFDRCEIATASQLQTWSASSPYRAVNLYIGGSCRSCANSALSAEFLTEAAGQGWKFIPTWAGPQSSCFNSCGGSKIESDVAAAYDQGIAEADAALAEAIRLGLAAADGSGTVVYYDLEAFGSGTTTCRNAAKSFISGWTKRIEEKGSIGGLYGATCGSFMSDFAAIDNVPGAIWPAYWTYASFNSNASVWNLLCLSNDLWPNQQRIRQYAGAHIENWGGVALALDSNVIDGIVAARQPASSPSPTPSSSPAPSPTSSVTPSPTSPPTATATSTLPPAASPTATNKPPVTATPSSTPVCEERILNGGFEGNASWDVADTVYPAGYSTDQVHSGTRALRAGIVNTEDNLYSFSSATQTITLPAGAAEQILRFWLYTQSAETGAVRLPENLPALEGFAAAEITDRQLVLIQDSEGQTLEQLLIERLDDRTWREFSFDISHYAGSTIRVYFGVYNDGSGGRTGMYVDDVSLGACAGTAPTASPTAVSGATATASAVPTASRTPTATATPVPGAPFIYFAPAVFEDSR